jgi:hypothetical protein
MILQQQGARPKKSLTRTPAAFQIFAPGWPRCGPPGDKRDATRPAERTTPLPRHGPIRRIAFSVGPLKNRLPRIGRSAKAAYASDYRLRDLAASS